MPPRLTAWTSSSSKSPRKYRHAQGLGHDQARKGALTPALSPKQDINGRYLSSNASTIGIYDDGDEGSAIRVYKTTSQKAGCSQLHTYPVGIVDHALARFRSNGMMTLTDMVNPAGAKPEDAEWDAFRVSDGKLTNDGQGRWVAFPGREGSWSLKWTDGKPAPLSQRLMTQSASIPLD